jgi:biopolymer transport protein ExbB
MKKLSSLLVALGLVFTTAITVYAQEDGAAAEEAVEQVEDTEDGVEAATEDSTDEVVEEEPAPVAAETEEEPAEEKSGLQVLKEKFIEGGAGFMALPLICLILGLAIALERIISLNWLSINKDKFVNQIDEALGNNIEEAKEICRNTRGPIASIYYQGLDRSDEGSIEVVEKSVEGYGSVQMGQMEKGLVWISLFIALAPMLGFLGTVIGMIEAFDAIEAQGDISPKIVAGGIKVALLTTVAGLIVAIILQLFYNYLVSKVDSIVNDMEDASISLVDLLIKHNKVKA